MNKYKIEIYKNELDIGSALVISVFLILCYIFMHTFVFENDCTAEENKQVSIVERVIKERNKAWDKLKVIEREG